VQLGTSLTTNQLSQSDARMSKLNKKIAQKKAEVDKAISSFEQMNLSLSDIKSQFEAVKQGDKNQLIQLKQQNTVESEDTELAKLFEQESISLR
jgi:hypothetical protein